MAAKQETLVQASFLGMRDTLEPETGTPRYAQLLQNVYPLDADKGGGVIGRPGWIVSNAGSPLGTTGNRQFQYLGVLTKNDGTVENISICGGLFYVNNIQVTLTTGIAVTTNVNCFACNYNGTLVVNPNDGANKPWTFDGSVFTSLTNAPLAFGAPTVYYGKLFFIVYGTRNEIMWSEENAANTGYNSGGFVNFWQLTQTSQDPLFVIYGTNEALYYWRQASMGRILGAVTPTFVSDGTHDAVSESVGTRSPGAVIAYASNLYFGDTYGRPHVLLPGGTVLPLWKDYRQRLSKTAMLPTTILAAAVQRIPLVLIAEIDTGSQPANNFFLTIKPGDIESPASGVWSDFESNGFTGIVALGDFRFGGAAADQTVIFGGTDGYSYYLDRANPNGLGVTTYDLPANVATAVTHEIDSGYLGYDPRNNRQFDRVRASFRGTNSLTGIAIADVTHAGTETTSGLTTTSASTVPEQVADVGISGYGRYCQIKITHTETTATNAVVFGLNTIAVDTFNVGPDPVTV